MFLPMQAADLKLEASPNLVDWTVLPAALTLTNGALRVQDPEAANQMRRFYRVLQ